MGVSRGTLSRGCTRTRTNGGKTKWGILKGSPLSGVQGPHPWAQRSAPLPSQGKSEGVQGEREKSRGDARLSRSPWRLLQHIRPIGLEQPLTKAVRVAQEFEDV